MSLAFPNPSRSYDRERSRVCFWGHDSVIEVPFFLEENAIFALCPDTQTTEAGILAAFDLERERILAAASSAYRGQRQRSYTLSAAQF